MLTERECWGKIDEIVGLVWKRVTPLSTAEIEKLNTYVNFILIRRRVEALEE